MSDDHAAYGGRALASLRYGILSIPDNHEGCDASGQKTDDHTCDRQGPSHLLLLTLVETKRIHGTGKYRDRRAGTGMPDIRVEQPLDIGRSIGVQ